MEKSRRCALGLIAQAAFAGRSTSTRFYGSEGYSWRQVYAEGLLAEEGQ